jgi:adenylate cyclase
LSLAEVSAEQSEGYRPVQRYAVVMTCPVCGTVNSADTRFCGDCGTALAADGAGPANPLPTPPPGAAAARTKAAGGWSAGERRLVTALFADLSGFTALAQRVDAEELLEIVDPIVSGLSSIAARNGAFVEKFAGDALLAVFGAPIAHEDDAERALVTAIEMHGELERVRRVASGAAGDLTLHVGIDSGHGIARTIGSEARVDYGVLGDSVILAQRLETHAPAGETYVGATTVALARDRFVFEPVGPLTVKGRDEPVAAWRLVGRATDPSADEAAKPFEVVGRDGELLALEGLVGSLDSGIGAIAVVSGEPGVGKTTLVEALRRRVATRRVRWLWTRCLVSGTDVPYRPWADLVLRVAGVDRDVPADRAAPIVAASLAAAGAPDALPYLARLAGVAMPAGQDNAADETARIEPEAFRRALHEACCRWITRLSDDTPLALVVEDVHWIDGASLDLLRDVAGQVGTNPILLCLTTRPEGAADAASVVARGAAARARGLDLALAPLPTKGVDDLIRRLLGGAPPDRLVRVLADRTGGNPYFVTETLRDLREAGALERAPDGSWRLDADWGIHAAPETIEGILAGRIDRLSPAAVGLLQQASVIGRQIHEPLLRAVATEPEQLDERVDELVEAGFLDRGTEARSERLAFHHTLVQDVAYGRLLRRTRRELHLRTADAAEALYGSGDDSIDFVARHLYLAQAGARAVDALLRAAGRARGLFANDEAIVGFERALEIARATPEAAEQVPEMLLALGGLHDLRGDYEAAAAIYSEVRTSTGDPRAWRGLATVRRRQGSYADALKLLDDAELELPTGSDGREIYLERASTLLFAGRFAEAARAAEAGLALVGGAAPDLATAGSGAGGVLAEPADLTTGRLILQLAAAEHQQRAPESQEAALRHARAAEVILRRFDDVRGLVVALRTIGSAHLESGQQEDAASMLVEALRLAERTGGVEEIGGTLIDLGLVRLALGQPELAVEDDRRAIAEFGRVGHASGRMIATANLAEALVAAGELDEAVESAADAIRLATELDDPITTADVTLTLARERLRRGDHAAAIERAEDASRRFRDLGEPSTATDALRLGVEAARASGSEEQARVLEARVRSLEDPSGGDGTIGRG